MNKPVPSIANLAEAPRQMIRAAFGEALAEEGQKNEKVAALCADLTDSIKISAFKAACPERYFAIGVAEQNMMGIAAGLALSGYVPFVASYAAFNPGRNFDQIRVSVAYSEANVKIIGAHSGISVGPDGATHQMLEDIAMMRALPNMTVIVPTDYEEMKKILPAAIAHKGPVYIRFGREKSATVTVTETPFKIGKANLLREGRDLAILACGQLVYEALLAAEKLAEKGVEAQVWAFPTIKPLDKAALDAAAKTGAVVTAEEAQLAGGFGSAVGEYLSATNPVPIVGVGIEDTFGESGTPDELMDKYGLRAKDIVQKAKQAINLKK